MLRSTPIISRGKSLRNYKVHPKQSPVFSFTQGEKKLLWTEECRLGSCPITSHAVFLTNTTVAGHTHTHTHKASYFSLISMPTFSSFVDHQHQKNVFKRMINPGISPATQWLRLHASAAVIVGSILDQGTMIQHATGRGQKFKKKKR